VAVDGSLYKKHPHFKDRMIAAMKEMEPSELLFGYEVVGSTLTSFFNLPVLS